LSRAWLSVLALADKQAPHVSSLKSAVAQARHLPRPHDAIALRCAVTFFAVGRPASEQFARAVSALDGWPDDGISVLVSSCLVVLRSEGDYGPATELGCCLIDLIAAGEVQPGSSRGGLLAGAIRLLARSVPGSGRDRLEFHAVKRGGVALGWWKRETGMRARMGEGVGHAASSVSRLLGGNSAGS
jgi:hypothetical protein